MDYARRAFVDDLYDMERPDLEETAYDYDVDYESDFTDDELREVIIAAYDEIYG